jgi:type III restriction enzyme
MVHLYQRLAREVDAWRASGYAFSSYPALTEILEWSRHPGGGNLRYLRRPQLQALETYWYLRVVEGTPHVLDLYKRLFPRQSELLTALGLDSERIKAVVLDEGLDALLQRVKEDDGFVKEFKLESVRETLRLDYPSYILALAMGAGKTILIGAIIATEFAFAIEYPEGPFVHNALVFAPGKTIIESLRELAEVPYEKILPPRLHRTFSASVKLTFTRDGERDVPVIRGSLFNVVVTNTEKIRIQKETIRKSDLGVFISAGREDEARAEIANLRLQAIASLPRLAVFSDEAHHTYGQSLDTGLKKVRKTVDYLAQQTSFICVVNTTGTPYFQRQPLKDVVIWYGLSAGIKDGILKDLAGNIEAYDFEGSAAAYVAHVIEDFFRNYGGVQLPNGAPAKLAIYFPQTDDLRNLRPVIDQTLVKLGQSPALCLVNTADTTLTRQADIDAFNRLNDPNAPHRVILLVNKGTEGWNCPSLFACALARRLRTSNNFVLQAATRCLRQVPGNAVKARVYLSTDNFGVLDRQLQETYGETIADLNRSTHETRSTRIILRKRDVPPLVVTQLVRTVVRNEGVSGPIRLELPTYTTEDRLIRTVHTLADQQATLSVLRQLGDAVTIDTVPEATDAYALAVELAARYRLDIWSIFGELTRLYRTNDVPFAHLDELARQIEEQTRLYHVLEETVDRALALVKPEGFKRETDATGAEIYTAEIVYPKDRERLLLKWEQMAGQNPHDFSFHYTPYDFDSNPEQSLFEQMLAHLNLHPSEVEDIYFTGALTDPSKTDFFVEYKDDEGRWHRYTPDFVIRKKAKRGRKPGSGRVYIVEVKREHDRAHPTDGENGKKALALRKWENLNPERLKYEMVFSATDVVALDQLRGAKKFVEESER